MILHHALTHAQAVRVVWSIMGVLLLLEGCALMHFMVEQHDVFAGMCVLTTWAKDSVAHLVSHFFEEA